jgi:hypothetical protein
MEDLSDTLQLLSIVLASVKTPMQTTNITKRRTDATEGEGS